jgi:DNA-binding helix-hairpin-helix protein with protein kinase domain
MITEIRGPEDDPLLPSERSWTPPAGVVLPSNTFKVIRTVISISSVTLVIFGMFTWNLFVTNVREVWFWIAIVLAIVIWPRFPEDKKAAAKLAYSAANAEWQTLLQEWQRAASRNVFTEKLEYLHKAYTMLVEIPKERQRRLAKLESDREKLQRKYYLARFRIDRANIMGIGPSRSSTLIAYGIVTAADVVRGNIMNIPGFGAALTTELVSWRQVHEGNFRFNPSDPEHRRDLNALDRELEIRRQILLPHLMQGPDTLKRLSQEINTARLRLMPLLEQAWIPLKIAEAHRNALRIWNF